MKQPLSSRRIVKTWHRRERATIDHLVRPTGDTASTTGTTHSPFTSTGLAVEDQVRKVSSPSSQGLPIF
ncbi:MAG: hypothetical protein WA459_07960 [Stellaceae bacterium]